MRLHNAFLVALGLVLMVSFLVVAGVFYRSALRQAQQEATREGRMILAAAGSSRDYTTNRIQPLIDRLHADPTKFSVESVPAFAAQTIMKQFNSQFPEYTYREAALNPSNVDDLPRSWEVDIIKRFRDNPTLPEVSGERYEDGQLMLYIAQPISVSDASCLACHGDPQKAPAEMISAYGSAHGFGWQLNEIIGAKFVMVPKSKWLSLALTNIFWFLVALGCVLLIAVVVSVSLIEGTVVRPLRRLTSQAEGLSTGSRDATALAEQGPFEFRSLARAINRLHRSLVLMMRETRKAEQ
jgi:protein-histidine pros-kinase